jgi:hypothetical protein
MIYHVISFGIAFAMCLLHELLEAFAHNLTIQHIAAGRLSADRKQFVVGVKCFRNLREVFKYLTVATVQGHA